MKDEENNSDLQGNVRKDDESKEFQVCLYTCMHIAKYIYIYLHMYYACCQIYRYIYMYTHRYIAQPNIIIMHKYLAI